MWVSLRHPPHKAIGCVQPARIPQLPVFGGAADPPEAQVLAQAEAGSHLIVHVGARGRFAPTWYFYFFLFLFLFSFFLLLISRRCGTLWYVVAVPTTIEENGHLNTCCVCEAPVPVDGMAYIRVKCCGRTLHKECKERFYGELGRHHCPHCRVCRDCRHCITHHAFNKHLL